MTKLQSFFIDELKMNERYYELFMEQSYLKIFTKKELLLSAGQVCNFIGFVEEGVVRSFIQNDGEEFNNDFYFENYFASAYTSFLTQTPSNLTLEALTSVRFRYLSYHQFSNFLESDNEWLKLGKYLSDNFFIRKCRRESSFLRDSAQERYQGVLKLYPNIEQQVSQYHIASYLGIKPETLSRLKALTYIKKLT